MVELRGLVLLGVREGRQGLTVQLDEVLRVNEQHLESSGPHGLLVELVLQDAVGDLECCMRDDPATRQGLDDVASVVTDLPSDLLDLQGGQVEC